ncbi:hypothetical protein GUJ93_ZPchr0039g14213 [Zizania palustris]|uniref:Association with the SNF1 complex (ASC) domain-containing protein n=1 Tax=Zizania palustris TaxID=103762 RepID=A0A8J5QZ86_ZIZPA|nr:hypothetical protein GUJ93_ZPchr0039g14213 [Zizania palustris]
MTSWKLLPLAIFHKKDFANLYSFGSVDSSHVRVSLLVLVELTGKCTLQAPVVPLHRPTEFSPVFNNSWINELDGSTNNHPQDKGIPTLITWSQGGNEVFVEGSWDNWTLRRVLERSGKDHTILGQVANLLDVHDYIPESLDSVAEFDAPPSPKESYDLQLPGDEEFAKEPPTLPPQLLVSVLGGADSSEEHAPKPKHVALNHLFIEKGWGSQSLLALGVTHRFQSKYVSFVLYKPLRRNWTNKEDAEASSCSRIQFSSAQLSPLFSRITQTRNLGKERMKHCDVDVDVDVDKSSYVVQHGQIKGFDSAMDRQAAAASRLHCSSQITLSLRAQAQHTSPLASIRLDQNLPKTSPAQLSQVEECQIAQ